MDVRMIQENFILSESTDDLRQDDKLTLSREFWSDFASSTWEKETFCQTRQLTNIPVPENELFIALVAMCEESLKHYNDDIRIYVEGKQLESDCTPLFPIRSDENFLNYRRRVQKDLNGKEFAFVIDGIAMPDTLRVWTHNFLKEMYVPLKRICYGHFWSIFFGSYTTTPYGVHCHDDPLCAESAFYFPLHGKKEMRTWRPEYVVENPDLMDSHDYDGHLRESTLLSAESGGMMYWPSDRWHVGSATGGDVSIVLAVKPFNDVFLLFCQAVATGMVGKSGDEGICDSFFRSKIRRSLVKGLAWVCAGTHIILINRSKRAKQRQIRDLPFDPEDLQASAQTLPESFRKIAKPFSLLLGKHTEKVLTKFWLFHLSGLGMESHAANQPALKIAPGLRMIRSEELPILWRKVNEDVVIVVANLIAREFPVCFLPVIDFVAKSIDGQELTYEELQRVKESVNPDTGALYDVDELLREFVEFLGTSSAFHPSSTHLELLPCS